VFTAFALPRPKHVPANTTAVPSPSDSSSATTPSPDQGQSSDPGLQAPAQLPSQTSQAPLVQSGPYRMVPGPQDDYFDAASLAGFLTAEYRVTQAMDRMAYYLDGPRLTHRDGYNIITDGVVPGCVQVPGTGMPIVLMRDAPTVGGYPKIGAVIRADLWKLAQVRLNGSVRFIPATQEEALAELREIEAYLRQIDAAIAMHEERLHAATRAA